VILAALLMLKGSNSLALQSSKSYFAVAHLRLLWEFPWIIEISLSLSALIIAVGVGYSSKTAIAVLE